MCGIVSVSWSGQPIRNIQSYRSNSKAETIHNRNNQTMNSNINAPIGFLRAIYFTIGLLLGKGETEF